MNFDEAFNIETIQLEPRLQEYMRRKLYNKENDIEPPIPEEQEFCITEYDKKIIKRHKQGKTKLYTKRRLSKNPHFIKPDCHNIEKTFEMAHDFKKDPRYKRLQNKMESHKNAQKQIRNLDDLDDEYHHMNDQCADGDSYSRFRNSNPHDSRLNKRPIRTAKPYDDPMNDELSWNDTDDSFMIDSRDLIIGSSRDSSYTKTDNFGKNDNSYIHDDTQKCNKQPQGKYCYSPNRKSKNPNVYHHPAKISYHQRLQPYQINGGLEHSQTINDIIGNIDSYNKHLDNTYDYIDSVADLDTHTFRSGVRTNTQRDTCDRYRAVPFRYGNGLRDISVEDSLRGGINDSSKKSVGFRNPFENQFSYISSDISDPNHSVFEYSRNTRGNNKEISRPASEAIKSAQRMQQCDKRYNRSTTNY